jgi:aminopeptidase
VHITSPAGTDLTFALAARPVFTDDGVVTATDQQEKLIYSRTATLPGGRVYGTCQETSATGQLAASPATWNGKPLQGLKGELKSGQLTHVRADVGNDDVQKYLAANDASVVQVSSFSIGLNPAMKPQEQKGFNPITAAGMVYVGMGNNALLGGTNQATSGNSFPIANATVEVDGTVVVRNGQLVSPGPAKAASVAKKVQK